MLTSLLSPGIFTDMRAIAAPDEYSWIETTISDFEAGDAHHVTVFLFDPGDPNDDGDVELESKLDQENWGPSKAPDTPKIYGDNAVAQTFITSRDGEYLTITLYLSIYGNPDPLTVELRTCVGDNITSAYPDSTNTSFLWGGLIESSKVPENGGKVDIDINNLPEGHISSGTIYALVLRQAGEGGDSNNYYKQWYDGDYVSGNTWKQSSGESGWSGVKGFGNHDASFRVFVNDEPGKGYYTEGTLTSSVYNIGFPAQFHTISWNATTENVTSIKFQIATDNGEFVGPSGNTTSYYTNKTGETIWSGHNGSQYVRYKAYLETTDTNITPVLHDITITYAAMPEVYPDISVTLTSIDFGYVQVGS
jgi:hypothetical protein